MSRKPSAVSARARPPIVIASGVEKSLSALSHRVASHRLTTSRACYADPMKIEGLEWMDWLHKTRRESEEERKRLGLSGEERLQRIEERAKGIREEVIALNVPVARDKPQSDE
jgi:hypothetical protein